MGQLGLSLDDKTLQIGGRSSLKPLSISRSLLLIRDVYSTYVPFGDLADWYKAISACTSRVVPPDTIESDNELHR